MLAGKNHVMRLGLVLALIAVCAVAGAFTEQSRVSASSPKGTNVVAHYVTRRPVSPNNSIPNGISPNATPAPPAPTCVSGDADASTAGCSEDAGVVLPLTGTLNASVGDAVVNGSSSVDLAISGQNVNFTLPTTIVDTRGGAVQWALSATSAGIPLNPAGTGAAGSLHGLVTLTTVGGACTVTASCTAPSVVKAFTSNPTLDGSTATTFATAPTGGDFGSTIVTTGGTIAIPANVLGGSYSGTITVTATPAIPV